MTASLGWNRYGKSRVRVMKVDRSQAQHRVRELTVGIGLEGAFESAHTMGDNSDVLPTDTMKNTVYALARQDDISTIETFALRLARHFLATASHIERAIVEIHERFWSPMGKSGDNAFLHIGPETPTCTIDARRNRESVVSGLTDMLILKTSESGFSDFLRDQYTTLKETDDRLLGTSLTARWSVASVDADFASVRDTARGALLDTFIAHESLSVQHTLYAMGQAAINTCDAIDEITLSMPNKHNLLVDLSPFELTNDNNVFLPIDEPFGLIEATIRRS